MSDAALDGRPRERDAILRALEAAAAGQSRVVVVRGILGSGRTALLDDVAHRAPAAIRLVRVAGHAIESGMAYAGADGLLRAAGLDAERLDPAAEPLEAARTVLAEITRAAAKHPLALLVDDAHLFDEASRRVLVFVARRLDVDAVGLVLVDEPVSPIAVEPVIELAPLDDDAARLILHARHPDLSAAVARRIIEEAAGLPLALVELAAGLTEAQRRGEAPTPAHLRLGAGATSLFAPRVAELSDSERLAALAATLETLDGVTTARVLAQLELSLDSLDAAERAALVAIDGGAATAHPAARDALHGAATYRERTRVHRALADVHGTAPLVALAHLRQLPDVPGPELVAVASEAAAQARATHAHARAGEIERFATAHAEDPTPHLHAAAQDFIEAGSAAEAANVLDALESGTQDAAVLARIAVSRTIVSMWSGMALASRDDDLALVRRCLDAGLEAEAIDLATVMATADITHGEYARAHEIGVIVAAACEPPLVSRLLFDVAAVTGGAPGAGAQLRSDWLDDFPWSRLDDVSVPIGYIAIAAHRLRETELLRSILRRMRARATTDRSVARDYTEQMIEASLATLEGRWQHAALGYAGLAELALDSDFTAPAAFVAEHAALLHAARGDQAACEQARARARAVAPLWSVALEHLDTYAAGLVALSAREHRTALEHLEKARAIERGRGYVVGGLLGTAGDAFEAAWHLGEHGARMHELEALREAAATLGHPGMRASVARCEALLAETDAMEAAFARALPLQRTAVEQARTELLWGVRLRRARRRRDARAHLLRAESLFDSLEASAWIDTCRSELAACGNRTSRIVKVPGGLARLTPREFEVASEVAAGASNVQAASRLFISERTVEYHLSSAYRKLGIDGRAALAQALET